MIIPTCPSEYMLFATVRIEVTYASGDTGVATGFFFNFTAGDGRILPAIVTNRHVVEGARTGRFALHQGVLHGEKLLPGGQSFNVVADDFASLWSMHEDSDIDLCAMPFKFVEEQARSNGKLVYRAPFGRSLVWPDTRLADLFAIEEILLVGYPIGLWDEANNLPLVRRGITASHPVVDYNGKSEGVIDVACFPGSSGSPVLIMNEGHYQDKSGLRTGADRVVLLGALFAGPCVLASGTITPEYIPTSERHTVVPQMVHLGFYVKAKEILELGKQMIAKRRQPDRT